MASDDRRSGNVHSVEEQALQAPDSGPSTPPTPAGISTSSPPRYRALRGIVLVGLLGVATLTMQQWIGDVTVYQQVNRTKAETLHRSILENNPPAGVTWDSLGANGTNIRLGAVIIAEAVHRATGLSVARTYLLLDSVYLVAGLLLFALFLATWFRYEYVLIGTLYLIVVLPLTYFLVSYHPWDRLAMVFWMLLLLALRTNRVFFFALLLPMSVAIKYDAVLLPGLYFLANVSRANWRRTMLITIGFFVLSFGTFFGLQILRPGGFAQPALSQQIAINFADLREMWLWYPPLLAFAVPVFLATIGFRQADRFMKACGVFGILLLVPVFLQAMFAEFRAQVPMLILILPCALCGLELLLGQRARVPQNAGTG